MPHIAKRSYEISGSIKYLHTHIAEEWDNDIDDANSRPAYTFMILFMFEGERKALSHNFLKFSIFIEIKIENNVRENHHETFFLLFCYLLCLRKEWEQTRWEEWKEGKYSRIGTI